MKDCFLLILHLALILSGCQKSSNVIDANELALEDDLQSFIYINEFVGQTPMAVNLWATEPLQSELKRVLGRKYDTFIKDVKSAEALKKDRVIYTVAAQPGPTNKGYILALFDTTEIQVEVFFIKKDAILEYASEGQRLYWPDEVRNLMYNYLEWSIYEGVLPCADCQGILTTLAMDQIYDSTKFQYFLQQVYLDTLDDDRIFQQRGTFMLRGDGNDANNVIYQLGSDTTEKLLNFLKISDDQLELLDKDHRRIEIDHNIRLHKVN